MGSSAIISKEFTEVAITSTPNQPTNKPFDDIRAKFILYWMFDKIKLYKFAD